MGLSDVFFINQDTGWAVGPYAIRSTVNGGRTWQTDDNISDDNYNQVYFVDSDHGWIACENIGLRYTTDGGKSWHIDQGLPAEAPSACSRPHSERTRGSAGWGGRP